MQLSLCLGVLQQSLDWTGLGWTGLKCLELQLLLYTLYRKWLFAYSSIMAGLLNDYRACLQQDRELTATLNSRSSRHAPYSLKSSHYNMCMPFDLSLAVQTCRAWLYGETDRSYGLMTSCCLACCMVEPSLSS